MFTYFIVAQASELTKMRYLEDVLAHVEHIEPMLGGNFALEKLAALAQVFLYSPAKMPRRIQYALADGSHFYQLDSETCVKIASSEHEQLLAASTAWEEAAWQCAEVNRMDLAGFLLDLSALCKQAQQKTAALYVLPVED